MAMRHYGRNRLAGYWDSTGVDPVWVEGPAPGYYDHTGYDPVFVAAPVTFAGGQVIPAPAPAPIFTAPAIVTTVADDGRVTVGINQDGDRAAAGVPTYSPTPAPSSPSPYPPGGVFVSPSGDVMVPVSEVDDSAPPMATQPGGESKGVNWLALAGLLALLMQ